MPYERQTWVDLPATDTPINAARLSHMEEGIEGATALAEDLTATPSGRELAYAESTVQQTGITNVPAVDLTGLTITFTVGARPVIVTLHLPWVTCSANTVGAAGVIADAAGTAIRFGGALPNTVAPTSLVVVERITVPGVYTRKGQLQRSGGTAGTVGNNVNLDSVVSSLRAVEC